MFIQKAQVKLECIYELIDRLYCRVSQVFHYTCQVLYLKTPKHQETTLPAPSMIVVTLKGPWSFCSVDISRATASVKRSKILRIQIDWPL